MQITYLNVMVICQMCDDHSLQIHYLNCWWCSLFGGVNDEISANGMSNYFPKFTDDVAKL